MPADTTYPSGSLNVQAALGPLPAYASGDSAPAGLAVSRRWWVTPLFLGALGLLSILTFMLLPTIGSAYRHLLAVAAATPDHELGDPELLGFRPFFGLFLALIASFSAGPATQRARFLVWSLPLYMAAVFIVDGFLAQGTAYGGPPPLSSTGSTVSAVVGLLVLVFAIFRGFRLPGGVRVPRERPRSWSHLMALLLGLFVAAGALLVTVQFGSEQMEYLRAASFGRWGGAWTVFFVTLMGFLFILSRFQRKSMGYTGTCPSVAFLVPAHNEAMGIEGCIRSLDAAAARFQGRTTLYLVDNGSTDGTGWIADRALAGCRRLRGVILHCPEPGKARALNHGLRHVTEDLVVRIDADTVVPPDVLEALVPHFADPAVGGVGGVPLPHNPTSWFGRMRRIEVYTNVGFIRIAQSAVDAVTVLPGMLVAYRRELLVKLGGFGEGFNGEDADATVRIGRLGYRIIVDPTIRPLTEMPISIAQLREQRLRWSRGLFHMAARNLSAIPMRQGIRGVWLLPWTVLSGCRRLVAIPLILHLAIAQALGHPVLSVPRGPATLALALTFSLFLPTLILLAYRQFDVVPFIPTYVAFALFRSYIGLETVLTLRLRGSAGGNLS